MPFPKKRKPLVFTQEQVEKLQAIRRSRAEEKRRTIRAGTKELGYSYEL